MKSKILIIEDDEKIANLVNLYLKKDGYETIVALDGKAGFDLYKSQHPSLVILDLMLPEIDGISILKKIRQEDNNPIIILSSKDEETDKIVGLELGADDYIVKPFSPKELVVRVKTVLRRTNQNAVSKPTYSIKNIHIDTDRFEIKKNGQLISATRREFLLLAALAKHPGKVYSRSELMELIYTDSDGDIFDRTIDVHVTNIRKKLDDKNQQIIATVTGIGYKMMD